MLREEAKDLTSTYTVDEIIDTIYDSFEAEIKKLQHAYDVSCKMYESVASTLVEERYKVKDSVKARSIVAMLFWEWRRLETEGITEEAFAAKVCFYKAYVLLKEKEMTRERFIKKGKKESKTELCKILYDTITRYEAHLKSKDKVINSLHQMCEDFDEEVKNKDKEIKWLNELIKKYESDD